MARILSLEEDWVEWLPSIDGNRDSEDPVSMELRPMSAEEYRAATRGIALGSGKQALARAQRVVQRIITERVRNVKNYSIGGPIVTGEDLAKRGEVDIVDEVFEALKNISVLGDGLKKKLTSPSDSLPTPTTPRGNGVASSAKVTHPANPNVSYATVTATPTQD